MIRRIVTPRREAEIEIELAVDYYADAGGEALAHRFVEALKAVYVVIGDNPEAGSSALGSKIGLPQLRTWNVRGFPYVVCYRETPERIEVVRVLHGQRDLPAELAPPSN